MAKMKNGESIKRSTAAVTPCRIVNSPVDLPGSAYSEWKNSGTIKVFSLMAWEHPRKGKGRFIVQDEVTKEYRITSPFIEHEIERSGWKEVAKEIYAQEGAVGSTLFTDTDIDKHAALYAREPAGRFNIRFRNADKLSDNDMIRIIQTRDLTRISLTRAKDGSLLVWAPLTNGRLDQSKNYIIGADISKGQGGEGTSETVFSVKCKQTGEIVAKFASKTLPPYDAAKTAAALCMWVGGAAPQRMPLIIPEANGPGWDFINVFVGVLHYPYCYRSSSVNEVTVTTSKKYGWHSTREGKELLLRAYERALVSGQIVNRDRQSLDQAKTYITYPSGGCGPAELSDKDKAAYLGHGDRVIADALTVMDRGVMTPKKDVATTAASNTWGGRFQAWERANKTDGKNWRKQFSFR